MKIRKFNFLCLILICCNFTAFSQSNLTVIAGAAMNMTPLQLVQTQLLGTGLTVSNATYNGSSSTISSLQIGTFIADSTAFTELGLPAGIIMTNGHAASAVGPNSSNNGADNNMGGPGDPDLTILAGNQTNDKCVLEFDFVPQSDTIRFRYVFGSEEFYEWCTRFNDAFGFFLSGPGINGTFSNNSVNIALMPGSANYVTIFNLCGDFTSNWCNAPSWETPPYRNCLNPKGGGVNFQYNGMSYVFTAWYVVTPCSTYHIKLAIADAGDNAWDSGVFLEKNSFSSTGLQINTSYQMPQLGFKAIEGCSDATVSFKLTSPPVTDDTINYTIGGTATNGVDYTTIPNFVIIPAGQDSTWLIIHPFLDNIPEGVETVILNIPIPSCAGVVTYHDTIYIFDNTTFTANVGNDTTTCFGDSDVLHAIALGGQSPYQYMWNTTSTAMSITVNPPVGINYYDAWIWDQCNNSTYDTIKITTLALPLITNPILNYTICSGGAPNIPLQSGTAGATFTWTAFCNSPDITGYSAGSSNVINQPLNNSGFTQDTVFYTVHAHIAMCTGPPVVFSVIVYPKPNVIFLPAGQNICSGQSTSISLFSSVPGVIFSWTFTSPPAITGATASSGPQITQVLSNSGTIADTVTYHVIATANGCQGNVNDLKIIVNPVAIITTTPFLDSICSGKSTDIFLTSSSGGSLFSWTATLISGTVTGFSDGNGNHIAQPLINPGVVPGIVRYHVIPTINGCAGQPQDFNIIVNPIPAVTNLITSFQQCSNLAINISLQSGVATTIFSWTVTPSSPAITGYSAGNGQAINQTLVNSGFNTDSVVYHVTPDYHGCTGSQKDFTVRVFPVPDGLIIPPAKTICSGTTTNIHIHSNVPGTLFTWTTTNASGNVSGYSNSVNPDTLINQTLNNSGNVVDSVVYHITPHANGCNGGTINYVVHVNPVANVFCNSAQTICSGNTTVPVMLTSNVTGGAIIYTWTTLCDPGISPCPSDGSGNPIPSGTLSDAMIVPANVVYTITASFNGCPGGTANHTVTVDPTPFVTNNPLSQTICSGLSSTPVILTANVPGTTFTWTAAATPGITGFTASGTNTIPAQLLHNSAGAPGTITYNILPLSIIDIPCQGPPTDYRIIVNPLPSPSVSGNSSACAQQQNVSYSTPGIPGNNYNWTITNGIITSGGNTNSITVTWGNAGTGSLKVIETVQSTVCSDSAFFNVTINPRPAPSISGPAIACELSSQNYSTPNFAGHSYNWTITGGIVQSGQGTNQITVNWGAAGTATINLTETILATGCSAQANVLNILLTSFPLAAGQISGPAQVCETMTNIVYSVPVITWATSYNWTYSGTGTTITNNGNTISVNFAAGATGGNLTVKGVNNCGNGPSSSYAINVHPLPVMSFLTCNDPVTTTSAQPFRLKGGLPLGGTYSGNGVNGGIFNPSLAGPGNQLITYSYTNTWICSSTVNQTIHVIIAGPFNCGNNFTDPRDSNQYPTVSIGIQCWLSANLNYGSDIPSTSVQTDNCVIEKYCYNDLTANCSVSGGLYQWDELMQYSDISGSQGLCPPGWHVPSENEWIQLFNVYNSNGFAGSPLKYTGFSGFDALLNGIRFENSSWDFPGLATFFWTSSSHGSLKAWTHGLNTMVPSVSLYPSSRSNAFPARCIKD